MRKICGFDFFLLANYLNEELSGGRIEKVYQPDISEDYIFKFMIYKKEKKELIAGKDFACITSFEISNPMEPSMLVMSLRKHLGNAFIRSVEQYNKDKILQLETDNNLLFLEFFGSGNIILCDKNKRIINALNKREWEGRTIKINETYKSPEREFIDRLFFGAFYDKVKGKTFDEAIEILSGFKVNRFFNALLGSKLTVKPKEEKSFGKEKKKIDFIAEQQRKKIIELKEESEKYYLAGNMIYQNFSVLTEIYGNAKNKMPDERIKKRDGNIITVEI